MTSIYTVFLVNRADPEDINLREVEANSQVEALELGKQKYENNIYFADSAYCDLCKHGGARAGAGRPSTYGERTKVIRVPESVAANRDLIAAIPELQQLLNELEVESSQSTSPRYYYLKKALAGIRNLGF